jgi:hypothetical protein
LARHALTTELRYSARVLPRLVALNVDGDRGAGVIRFVAFSD